MLVDDEEAAPPLPPLDVVPDALPEAPPVVLPETLPEAEPVVEVDELDLLAPPLLPPPPGTTTVSFFSSHADRARAPSSTNIKARVFMSFTPWGMRAQ
ncbi:MAG TPA: hypothetical protein VM164_07930 [Burkholderiales bacterium]|nr:hypothetical protein [Burkholderiales bacterium]